MTEQELKQNGITAKTTPNHKTDLLTKHPIITAAANCYYSTTETTPTTGLLAAQQQHNRRKTNSKNSTAPGSKKHSQQLRNRLGNLLQANCTTCQTPRLKPPAWHKTKQTTPDTYSKPAKGRKNQQTHQLPHQNRQT
jgi:hypothetical protein